MQNTPCETHYDPLYERRRQVLPLILRDELTQRQRLVIEEFYVKQKSTAQVAKALGISPSAAYRLRQRAEQRIAQCLRYCG